MNATQNKVWLHLDGQSLIDRCLATFQACQWIDSLVLVVNRNELADFQRFIAEKPDPRKPIYLVGGGKERQDSVANGLEFLQSLEGWSGQSALVVIHDAARPLLTLETLDQVN